MARRKSKNKTDLPRIEGVPYHEAWAYFICVNCNELNRVRIGEELPKVKYALENFLWKCEKCEFIHSAETDLPFDHWPDEYCEADNLHAFRFWKAFFRNSLENRTVFWKQCNTCGRILPNHEFSRHKNWGPLEKQMECRSCKAVINTELNPKRTKQQLHEASRKRRVADLLLEEDTKDEAENKINIDNLFERFDSKCFKTGKKLDKNDRGSWEIDHILPSKYLYPLVVKNAALLSKEANATKSDKWPRDFYTNTELVKLSKITGADIDLLSSEEPIINPNIDVDACVKRYLKVRVHSNLNKRVAELKYLLNSYNLVEQLSDKNKKRLGYE
jgi:hypothetical protein